MRIWVGLALAASCISGAAFAADAPKVSVTPPPVVAQPAPPFFNGIYVGLLGGYGWGTTTADATNPPGSWYAPDIHPKGWLAGGTIGFNWLHNDHVLGFEADAAWANITGHGGWNEDDSTGNPWSSKTSMLATIRARVGVPMGNFMPYLTGGLAYQNTNLVWSYELGTADARTQNFRVNPWGWTAGVGVEVAQSAKISWKVEYLYSYFGSKFEPAAITSDDQGGPGVKYSDFIQMLRFGVNLKLN